MCHIIDGDILRYKLRYARIHSIHSSKHPIPCLEMHSFSMLLQA